MPDLNVDLSMDSRKSAPMYFIQGGCTGLAICLANESVKELFEETKV